MLRKLQTLALAAIIVLVGIRSSAADPSISPKLQDDVTTISRADGTTVRGNITAYDPDAVTIKPLPKPLPRVTAKPKIDAPPVEPVPDPEPVVIAWKDIRHVSDGLTQRKALDAWEAIHRARLCPTCLGERTVWCPTCKGTAHDPAAAAGCKTCNGELLVDCKTSKCTAGKIACPNGCLQLAVGSWTKQPDGLRLRKFMFPNGAWQGYTEHHLGHIILYQPQLKQAPDIGICPLCGGTMQVLDPVCHGTGKMPCPTCVARKTAGPCPANCDHGRVVCPDCAGTGLKKV